jgi:hypothetical protein
MSKDCNRTVIAAKLPELARLFGALLVRRPSVNFQHFGVSSELVWKIRWSRCECLPVWSDGKSWYRVDPDERDLPRGKWTFKPIAVTRPLPPLFAWATKDKWAWLTCRSALYMYLFLLGVLVAAVRAAKWQYAVVALPVLVQSSIMALAGMGPCFRYQWSVYLVGMLCSGFLLLGVPLRPAASKGQEGANP